MNSVFRYYRDKFNWFKQMLAILQENIDQFESAVDVFGGSGKVMLNNPDGWKKLKVYNDLNEDLYTTFIALQIRKRDLPLL